MTKEFDINYEGKPAKVIIKKLKFGPKADLKGSFIKTMNFKGTLIRQPSTLAEMMVLTMKATILSAPFDYTKDEVLRDLDDEVGEMVYTECARFNRLEPESEEENDEAKKLSGPSNLG